MVVTNARMMNNAVTTDKITDSNITTAKLNNNAVTNAKIDRTAIRTIRLAVGEKLQVEDHQGFPLLQVDNDSKYVKIRKDIRKIR